jgi:hypothetical protein
LKEREQSKAAPGVLAVMVAVGPLAGGSFPLQSPLDCAFF